MLATVELSRAPDLGRLAVVLSNSLTNLMCHDSHGRPLRPVGAS
jgi:hypothetical protein